MANRIKQKKKRDKIRTNIVMILFVGLLLLFITQGLGIEMQTSSDIAARLAPDRVQVSPLAEYKIIETTTFEELWTISQVYVSQNWYGNGLIITNDSLYFIGSVTGEKFNFLNRLNLSFGQPDWQTFEESEWPNVSTFNSDYLFTGTDSRGRVTAYDLESGAVVWETALPLRSRAIYYMTAIENELFVNASRSAEFYILNIENGRIQERGHPRDVYPIFYAIGDIIYHGRFSEYLVASNKTTNEVLWEVGFGDEIVQAPLFIDNTVLVRTGTSGDLGEIFAIDLATGKILWSSPKNVVSNATASNGIAYYLTEDSHLIAEDLLTGQMVGSVEFTPSITTLEPIDQVNEDFYIVADDKIVVVYFGSGNKLFAFHFLE